MVRVSTVSLPTKVVLVDGMSAVAGNRTVLFAVGVGRIKVVVNAFPVGPAKINPEEEIVEFVSVLFISVTVLVRVTAGTLHSRPVSVALFVVKTCPFGAASNALGVPGWLALIKTPLLI